MQACIRHGIFQGSTFCIQAVAPSHAQLLCFPSGANLENVRHETQTQEHMKSLPILLGLRRPLWHKVIRESA